MGGTFGCRCRVSAGTCTVFLLLVAFQLTPAFEMNGMTFTNGKYCPNVTFADAKAVDSLQHMYEAGVDSVAVVVTQYMEKHDSTDIFPLYEPTPQPTPPHYYTYLTATEEQLSSIIQQAHQRKMKVMLKPHLDLIDDPKHWRGDIGVGFTAQQWDQWFDSYRNFLLPYVELAERLQVELISMSCELIEASKQAAHWRTLIGTVRERYHGLLTDSANWGWMNATGGEETNKTWWDAVDYIGVDAYYPIGNDIEQPTVQQLVEGWHRVVVSRLHSLHTKYQRPVLFTEIGFCSGDCSRNTSSPIDEKEQAIHYEAVFQTFADYEWFHGVFWWAWSTDVNAGGPSDNCITPQHKEAEAVLRRWYRAATPLVPPVQGAPVCQCTV